MPEDHFSHPDVVAAYLDGPRRAVPGLAVMHGLVEQILAESVPEDGTVLVVGAGGGLELAYLAERHHGWSLDGVDPSEPMLELARTTMGPLAAQARLHRGTVDAAPLGPFDAATCLLTLHFVPRAERLRTLQEIHRRLRPRAPVLVFHHSVPDGPTRAAWLARAARHAAGAGADPEQITSTVANLSTRLPLLSPEQDTDLLLSAGFSDVQIFYAALTFRGWLGYA